VAILDAILNYTFLPHIWNVYPSFFNLLWVPYRDQESKLGDVYRTHTGYTQDHPQPQDYELELRSSAEYVCSYVLFCLKSNLCKLVLVEVNRGQKVM